MVLSGLAPQRVSPQNQEWTESPLTKVKVGFHLSMQTGFIDKSHLGANVHSLGPRQAVGTGKQHLDREVHKDTEPWEAGRLFPAVESKCD